MTSSVTSYSIIHHVAGFVEANDKPLIVHARKTPLVAKQIGHIPAIKRVVRPWFTEHLDHGLPSKSSQSAPGNQPVCHRAADTEPGIGVAMP